MRILWVLLLACVFAVPLSGQEVPAVADEPEESEESVRLNVIASGWCTFSDSPRIDTDEEEIDEESSSYSDVGCDVGLGLSLFHLRPRLLAVGVLGSKSLGFGVAYVVHKRIAIAVGFIVPYDSHGIYTEPALALGATLNLKGE